jgi:hypothetical protein
VNLSGLLGGFWLFPPTGGANNPSSVIPIVLAIKQSFLSPIIDSLTKDREGLFDVARIVAKEDPDVT